MCAILDANCFSKFRDQDNEDMKPVQNWVDKKNGKIIYSDTEKFKSEWLKGGMKEQMRTLTQAGKLKYVPAQEVEKKADELIDKIESDDPHIIALAMIAKVKVLIVQNLSDIPKEEENRKKRASRGADPKLQRDFKKLVGGNVYITKSHSHLLTKDTCP